MKEKLELKHLAPYLPYGLKMIHNFKKVRDDRNKPLKPYISILEGSEFVYWRIGKVHEYKFKPILRPLSDLTKNEFTVDFGEWIGKFDGIDVNNITFSTAQKLFKYHFDVFGLIEKGLAIDINTLKN